MAEDKINLVEGYLNSIQNEISIINSYMKPEVDQPDKEPVLNASRICFDSCKESFSKMSEIYHVYQNDIISTSLSMIDSFNHEIQSISNNIQQVQNELTKFKTTYTGFSDVLDNFVTNYHTEPKLCFNGDVNHSYAFDIELMKQYPGSYFMELYNDLELWTDTGNINIDHDDNNYQYIMKYMLNDDSLLQDIKTMNVQKRSEFINDLDYFILPLKLKYMNDLFIDDDKLIMEAWRNKILRVNGRTVEDLNVWLKNNNMFDKICSYGKVRDMYYSKDNKIVIVNVPLKYGDFFNDYCKNQLVNERLLNINKDGYTRAVFDYELSIIGIQLNENERNIINESIILPSLILQGTNIVDRKYDSVINEWIEKQSKWKLLYRASTHHFSAKSFHKCCNNATKTIIVIKSTEGYIFGGYTSASWKNLTQEENEYKNDDDAFIFTLKNPHNVPPTKYNKLEETSCSICCCRSMGPTFCGYDYGFYDICIGENCDNSDDSFVDNDGSIGYECDPFYKSSLFVDTADSMSRNSFIVSEYEVYTIEE